MEPEIIADYSCRVGEGPLWHPMEKRLYWSDITTGRMFRFDPSTMSHEQFYDGSVVGGFTVQDDGSLLLFMEYGRIAIWKNGDLTDVISSLPGEEQMRFNDVIVDPVGRVFCGTIPLDGEPSAHPQGNLYFLDRDGSITQRLSGVGIANGMGFTLDRKQMYFTDSTLGIDIFDYDKVSGNLSNRKPFMRTEGSPDGMTVDSKGNIWSANWGSYGVFGYNSLGIQIKKIELPTSAVSSVTFGGDNYSDMYITTAMGNDKKNHGPLAGALFRVRARINGMPEFLSKIHI